MSINPATEPLSDDIMDAISRAARKVKSRADDMLDREVFCDDSLDAFEQDIIDELIVPINRALFEARADGTKEARESSL